MGNCQAVDNASFILQTQTGKSERFYSPVSAAEIMKLHPGHYVALLLTTTFYSLPPSSADHHHKPPNNHPTNTNQPLRVTRIKLLRPTDNLVLGHAYRLITTQEVIKGLKAKKNGKSDKYKDFPVPESVGKNEEKSNREISRSNQMRKSDKHRPAPANSKSSRSKQRGWHPSLNSISEASS
ncbi:hypothetical protein R6Q59_034107 [Mikania micrantha]|uniref:Uncharacterized protein n=1 Tax=Mikania micrantha TaxID=192012 RepID=A0A5N6NLG9_9ASTR|nr:hypothetical protein E3N88_21070 [Mikania micrantha]